VAHAAHRLQTDLAELGSQADITSRDKPLRDREGRRWPRVVAFVALAVAIGFALSVNLFPNINNDGVEYIAFSQRLGDTGLVHLGYRQFGYPLFLAIGRIVSGLLGVEPLLAASFGQRLLLAIAAGYAVWLWRWRALPLLFLVVTPSLLAYTNLILTEGLTVPLALLLACVTAHHFRVTARPLQGRDGRAGAMPQAHTAAVTAWVAVAITLALLAIRFPFAVFAVVPAAIWWRARREKADSRAYAAAFAVYLLGAALLAFGLTSENRAEMGVATPSARGERAMYWSAWHLVFTLHPENRVDPSLADFYDDGSPYFRIWEIEDEHRSYPDQAAILESSAQELLSAAGLSLPRERFFSLLGALRGGRLDDVRPRVEAILDTDASNVDEVIHADDVSRREGWDVFNDRYNRGSKPQAVITSPLFPSPPLPHVSDTLRLLLPAALLGSVLLSLRKRQALLGSVFLVPPLAYAAALAWLLADNGRFLMTTSTYAVAGFCALWAWERGWGADLPPTDHHEPDQA
jgi:hypothetical protein